MKNNVVEKLINNKLFLFIVPNLIHIYIFLYHYNTNFSSYSSRGEVLFYEGIILGGIFFTINILIYLFLKKSLKDSYKIFFILCFISVFYFKRMNLFVFLAYLIFILLFIIILKKCIYFNLKNGVVFISFLIIFLFSCQLMLSIYNGVYIFLKFKGYDYEFNVKVEEDTNTPNIYWIHCDGMMSFYDMKRYFGYDDNYLVDYLVENNFSYNEKTRLVAGHRTLSSLVAMFNPYYYDNFFGNYLINLEDSFIDGKNPSLMVGYYELEKKRLNNELFLALKKKNYTTVAISDFNQYTGFFTDYFYDFYVHNGEGKHITNNKEFRYLDNRNTSEIKLLSYMRFNHFKALLNTTMLYPILENVNYLDYEIVNYDNTYIKDYEYTNNTNYWPSKAIMTGINNSLNINNKFVFIDFKLNHLPITFNAYGDFLSEGTEYDLNYYLNNYIYSIKLLTEMLEYIKINDANAIVFVQGDHGIHMLQDANLRTFFDISQEELQDIRNSVISAYYIPDKYKNGDEIYLNNPLNISRYIVNNYIGKNYEYIS